MKTKMFFQASWVNRNGATVYSDIDTRWDRVHMQLPLYVVNNYTKHIAEEDSEREAIRCGSLRKPTPRAERETAVPEPWPPRHIRVLIGDASESREFTSAPLTVEAIRKVVPVDVYKTYAPGTDYCTACKGWHEPPTCRDA